MGGTVAKLNPVNAIKGIIKNPVQGLMGAAGGSLLGSATALGPLATLGGASYGANSYSPTGPDNPYVPGPFSLDPAQLDADRTAITNLGQTQYRDTLEGIDTAGKAAQDYAGQTLQRMLPGIEEDLNSKHLLNSSALPQELGRQASSLAQDVAAQQAQAKLAALNPLQANQQQSLQRGLSLEDFITNANVAKTLGAQMAPQVNNGKANTGALLQGAGSLATGAKGLLK